MAVKIKKQADVHWFFVDASFQFGLFACSVRHKFLGEVKGPIYKKKYCLYTSQTIIERAIGLDSCEAIPLA